MGVRYVVLSVLFLVLHACKKEHTIQIGQLEASTGGRNEITLVIEDSLWSGAVGDSIRKKLAAPVLGLPKSEPQFDLVQYNPRIFSSKARKSRNVVLFSVNEEHQFNLERSLYATPQNFFFLREKTTADLIRQFHKQADSIIHVIRNLEMNEEQHEIGRSLHLNTANVKEVFACTITIPASYHLMEESDNHFIWYQRELTSGDVNLVLYEVPIAQVEKGKGSFYNRLIMARDSVTQLYIKGNKPDSYLITAGVFDPYFFDASLQDFPALEIRGNWEMKNDFMTGPFISYVVKDDYYQRYLFIDGFVNNPFKAKRDILMEIEAIIKTTNFYEL